MKKQRKKPNSKQRKQSALKLVDEQIEILLKKLKKVKGDRNLSTKIRKQLRKLGHKGGLK